MTKADAATEHGLLTANAALDQLKLLRALMYHYGDRDIVDEFFDQISIPWYEKRNAGWRKWSKKKQ